MLRNAANLIGAIAALSFLILASCMPNYTSELPGKQGEISSTMRYMGGVDGKHFFMDRSHYMNWTAAYAACNASNLQLAAIESKNEANLVLDNFNKQNLTYQGYWTSARETVTVRGLDWHHKGTTPREDVIPYINYNYIYGTEYTFCGFVYADGRDKLVLGGYRCSTLYYGALCQV